MTSHGAGDAALIAALGHTEQSKSSLSVQSAGEPRRRRVGKALLRAVQATMEGMKLLHGDGDGDGGRKEGRIYGDEDEEGKP
jgi:hypothetical protein